MLRARIAICLTLVIAFSAAPTVRADTGDDQYTVAAGHYAAQRWALAADEFRLLLKEHPDHAKCNRAIFFLAEALVQLGRYDEARTEFQEFVRRDPDSEYARQALFRAGESALMAGKNDEARQGLEQFREKYPDDNLNAYALNYLGEMRLTTADGAGAEKLFQEALRRFPKGPTDEPCRLGMARALEAQREWAEALKSYEQFEHDFAASRLLPQAHLGKARTLYQLARYDEARPILEPLTSDAQLGIEAQYWLGLSWNATHDWAAAQKPLAAALQTNPAHPLAPAIRYQLADAQIHAGRFDDAIATLEAGQKSHTSADRDPQALANRYLLALAQQGAKRHDAALALLDSLDGTAQGELRDKVLLARAASLLALERFADAAAALEAYLKSQPEGPYSDRALAELAVCNSRAKHFDAARDNFAALKKKSPPAELLLSATQQVADAAMEGGDPHWAAELYAVLAADGNPPAYIARGLSGLGWCQFQSGDLDGSAANFEQLLKRFPSDERAAEAAWVRGQALERLAKFEAALAADQLVIEKYPASKQFPDALLAAAHLDDQLHHFSQAADLYERFIHEHPHDPRVDAAYYGWAWTMCDANQRPAADKLFQKLHDDFRGGSFWQDATFRLAESAAEAKQPDRARQLLDELSAAKPSPAIRQHAMYLEGQLAAAAGKWDQVEKILRQLVHDFPDSTLNLPANYWIAEAVYRQGRYDEAGPLFEQLVGQTTGRKDKWLAMIPLRRAQVLAQKKQWADAQTIAAHIESDFPGFAEQYEADYVVGRALASQADFAGARKAYLRVVQSATGGKTETAAMAQWMIGETYFHQEKYEAALREYLRVEILYPYPRWQAAALLQAGKCHETLGQWKEAAELYGRLIKLYPNTEFTDEATKRFRAAGAQARNNTDREQK